MITTEALVTSPLGFNIATASPAQRAACRVIDGRPLGELRDHGDVQNLVGGLDVLDSLPSERGEMPPEVCFLASVRSLKTIIALAAGVRATQVVDVSGLTHGEIPRVTIMSLKMDTAAPGFHILRETILASPMLRRLLVGEPMADSLMLRHPSGRPIEIACVAGAKAGAGLVARWSAGVIFDEAPRMAGQEDGIVNLDHARSSVLGRLLPGASALYIGSAWAPRGTIYNFVSEFWRKPRAPIVVLRGTGPMLNPTWWTPDRCAALKDRDPVAYATDVMGEFADPESGLLPPMSVSAAKRESPLELPPRTGGYYVFGVDPSEGGYGNGFSLVGLRVEIGHGDEVMLRVALAREYRGLSLESIWCDIACEVERYGCSAVVTDQYAAAANVALAARYGLRLHIDRSTQATNLEDYTNLATLVHSGQFEFSPHKQLLADVLSVRKRVTQQGYTIVLGKTQDGRHADFASALVKATKYARLVPEIERTRSRIDYRPLYKLMASY